MRTRLRNASAAGGAVGALLLGLVAPAGSGALTVSAGPGSSRVMSDAQIAALSQPAQTALLAPLRRLAADLDGQGRSRWVASYAGVRLDAPGDTVDLYATDTGAGRALIAAARQADPGALWQRVRLAHASYSRGTLERVVPRFLAGPGAAGVRAVSVPVDGSGLDAEVTGRSRLTDGVVLGSTVPVRFHAAAARTAKSWAGVKWQDSAPFIGGDVLTADGRGYCTAGLPAVRRSDGRPVMVSAAHCFPIGQRVYTAAGTPGAFGNGRVGNYVGAVTARSATWDAALIVGADNNADESDTGTWRPLTSVAYSFEGDYVCQNGSASYFLGHPTPCGIKVTDDDLWFPVTNFWARGVEGIDVLHGWGSHNGDSGATVFAVEPGGVRQARGIVSSGGNDGTPDQRRVDWTEAVDIFRAYGLRLNPRR